MYTSFASRLQKYFPSVVRRNFSSIERVDVDVTSGTVRGVVEKLPDGNEFCAFRGIPYAKAPTGSRRFQPPEPLTSFPTTVLDCSLERDVSLARNPFDRKFKGSEDCLHLNVYVPRSMAEGVRYPVMVFIHGGSFKNGSGNSDCYSPEYLIQENVIVVTMNYRLGPLGLLHLPSQGIEGNAALKDQLMALRWVGENIGKFNGDPQNVTLFGESAGAVAVHIHLLSPLSTRYFHKAICQSGVSLAEFGLPNDTMGNGRRLAKLINPSVQTDAEVLETLRNAPAKDLIELSEQTPALAELRLGMLVPFRPVVDTNSDEPIYPLHAIAAMQYTDRIPSIPLMLGYNNRDGATFVQATVKHAKQLKTDLKPFIPSTLHVSEDSLEADQVASDMKSFYFGPAGYTPQQLDAIADLLTDSKFSAIHRITAEMHARFQHRSPLYFYRFAYDGMLNLYKKLLPSPIAGAYHADDLGYLFRMRMFPKEVPDESEEARVRRYMCRMWTNFAKYGNPTPAHDESLPFHWNPVPHVEPNCQTRFRLPYLNITAEPQMGIDPDQDRFAFWEKVYRKHNGSLSNL